MVSDEAEKKVEQERNRLATFSNQRYSLVHQLANIVRVQQLRERCVYLTAVCKAVVFKQ